MVRFTHARSTLIGTTLAAAVALGAAAEPTHELLLTNGDTVKVEILEETETTVKVNIFYGTLSAPRTFTASEIITKPALSAAGTPTAAAATGAALGRPTDRGGSTSGCARWHPRFHRAPSRQLQEGEREGPTIERLAVSNTINSTGAAGRRAPTYTAHLLQKTHQLHLLVQQVPIIQPTFQSHRLEKQNKEPKHKKSSRFSQAPLLACGGRCPPPASSC